MRYLHLMIMSLASVIKLGIIGSGKSQFDQILEIGADGFIRPTLGGIAFPVTAKGFEIW